MQPSLGYNNQAVYGFLSGQLWSSLDTPLPPPSWRCPRHSSKIFSQALQGCQGLLPVTFGPPATAEATAAFAEWLTKYGHLAGSLELQLLPKDGKSSQQDCAPGVSQRTFTELAIAAALGKAAAAGSNSGSSHGLCIRSCKLSDAGLDSAAILQALPGSTLTSLDLDLAISAKEEATALMDRLSTVLPSLQQLRQLQLECDHEITCDAALSGFGTLTSLTCLVLHYVATGEPLQHLPASLQELQLMLDDHEGPLQLGHLTALTELSIGQYVTLWEHHVLPPNLLELSAGNLAAAACLLPLTRLEDLTLETKEHDVAPAQQLQQLSSLTTLTAVHLTYWGPADATEAAAAGWQALKLRSLSLSASGDGVLASNTLLRLSSLTGLTRLHLSHCGVGELTPEQLAATLAGMPKLRSLHLCGVHWGTAEDEAANSLALAALLRGLADRRRCMLRLTDLSLYNQHVGRAAAAAIAQMRGLQELSLMDCQLEDCSAAEIALGLKPWLKELDLACNKRLTDGCLPVLAYAVPRLQASSLRGCSGVTQEGLAQYLPGDTGDSGSDSDTDSD
ncbi:hypothetical protein OEZ85_005645 [Tetradesmus obliquus]|uniref:Uncharacterized protein n=1 Tax=Tetradesmus obliquus TaxID=3088 RepID=A0ABY8UE37_TETOB|nr:hypothetical protein OEZ85_005645 [Tetradesmus obliquus]